MPFDVGDRVVYPQHGAAVIEKRETKAFFGEEREYLVLKVAFGDLTVMVPADNTDEVLALLTEEGLGLTLLDHGSTVLRVDNPVTDVERHASPRVERT